MGRPNWLPSAVNGPMKARHIGGGAYATAQERTTLE
jgi:hypothetical protein